MNFCEICLENIRSFAVTNGLNCDRVHVVIWETVLSVLWANANQTLVTHNTPHGSHRYTLHPWLHAKACLRCSYDWRTIVWLTACGVWTIQPDAFDHTLNTHIHFMSKHCSGLVHLRYFNIMRWAQLYILMSHEQSQYGSDFNIILMHYLTTHYKRNLLHTNACSNDVNKNYSFNNKVISSFRTNPTELNPKIHYIMESLQWF